MDQDVVPIEDAVPIGGKVATPCSALRGHTVVGSPLGLARSAAREVRLLVVCLLSVRDAAAQARLRRSALTATLRCIEAGHSSDPRQVKRFLRGSLQSTREVCSLSRRYAADDRLSSDEAAKVLRIGDRAETLLVEALAANLANVAALPAPAGGSSAVR